MRAIKFRAWDPVTKNMFVPEFVSGEFGEFWFDDYSAGESNLGPYPNKAIPMQYTGLHDKNGKEIYEGDVLRHPKVCDTGPVEWDNIEAGFHWLHPKMYNAPMDECEVIGNIYENPELVGGD